MAKNNSTELNHDEMQDCIERLKETSRKIEAENPRRPFTTRDIVSDIIFFFVTVAVAFGWVLLMLLILSFVSLTYLHFEIKYMLLCSGVAAGIAGIVYVIRKVSGYRDKVASMR